MPVVGIQHLILVVVGIPDQPREELFFPPAPQLGTQSGTHKDLLRDGLDPELDLFPVSVEGVDLHDGGGHGVFGRVLVGWEAKTQKAVV